VSASVTAMSRSDGTRSELVEVSRGGLRTGLVRTSRGLVEATVLMLHSGFPCSAAVRDCSFPVLGGWQHFLGDDEQRRGARSRPYKTGALENRGALWARQNQLGHCRRSEGNPADLT
jgi:hypothetical protein